MKKEKKPISLKGKEWGEQMSKIMALLKLHKFFSITIIATILFIFFVVKPMIKDAFTDDVTVLTESSLMEVLDVSELSTSQTVYNGVARVYDQEDKDEILYYVSYEATIKAGINMLDLSVSVNNDEHIVIIKIPEIIITDIAVDMETMDYLFNDSSADTETISMEAYKACEKDAQDSIKENKALKDLAKDNLKSVIKGLTKPILDNQEEKYTLNIE